MKKVIFNKDFSFVQYLLLIVMFIVIFNAALFRYIEFFKADFGDIESFSPLMGYTFFLLMSLIILGVIFSKKGVIIENNNLYKSFFLFGFVVFKKKMDLFGITDVSVLKFRGVQKYVNFSKGNPDLGYETFLNQIYLLNSKHTVKNFLISSQNAKKINEAVELIQKDLHLEFNIYSPDF